MINLEHKLTVDDLIVEYMMYKVKNGYEPSFTTGEFINFLLYFETKMPVFDTLYDGEELFKRFMERKCKSDWSITKNYVTLEKEEIPHMDLVYSEEDSAYVLKANYRLSDFDKSVINTYFMDNKMSQFDHYDGTARKIRNIIGEWLKDFPKKEIDDKAEIEDVYLIMGKYLAAEIIDKIWKGYISDYIKSGNWPKQCKDMEKYLLDVDLAEVIGLKSIKAELLELYEVISKRIALMYVEDSNLRISSSEGTYLANANYKRLTKGYENLFKMAFGPYKSTFLIDMEKLAFTESHEIDRVYDWDEDAETVSTTSRIGNTSVKNLVKKLDNISIN